jgi:outer membrane lipoprotein-sorting protein
MISGRKARGAALAVAAGLAALLAAAAPPEPTTPARPVLAQARAHLRDRAGLRAEFRQVSEWAALGEADTSRGILTVAPSGRFLLDYAVPRGHRIGSDGARVWTYVPEERQVLRARVKQTTGWSGLFFESLAAAADSLAVVTATPDWGRVARVALVPRPEWGLAALHAVISLDSGLPVGYGYTDEEGNRIGFRFTSVRLLDALPDTLFRFSVPPGYALFDAD